MCVSQPCCVTSTSGRNARTSGNAVEWKARSHPASEVPGGSETFVAYPSALDPPVSEGHPVPGKSARPDSWIETVRTRGSSQKIRSTPSPWWTSTSTYATRSTPPCSSIHRMPMATSL